MRREYAQRWTEYTQIFNDQLFSFFSEFDRARLKSIYMRNMCFAQFDGLQVLEGRGLVFHFSLFFSLFQKLTRKGLTRPCEEYLVRNDIYELDLVNFFDSTLTPMNQQNFSSQLEILSLTVFRCDGDMLDNQGLGRKFSNRFSKRLIFRPLKSTA